MKLKTATVCFCALLLGTFATLFFSSVKIIDLLDLETQEIANTGESVRIAQGLKVRLLAHNRNSFLYSLHKNPLHLETKQLLQKEIVEFLNSAEQQINDEGEHAILEEAEQKIEIYLKKRTNLETKPISPSKRYTQLSQNVDEAISSIDKLIAINRSQMSDLLKEIKKQNNKTKQLALSLFLFGGLILLGSFFSVFVFVARPLIDIAHMISRYSKKETSVRIKLSGLREIRAISSNFNSMAQNLEEKRQDQLRFIASIAHDLRNPLNSMSIASELLISSSQEKYQKFAKIIFRQIRNLDRLVSDLLDSTRIESGQIELNLSENDINLLIRDLVELHRTGSDLFGFKIELPNEALTCKCDIDRLSQVMNNLLSNAIKYSPNGGTISIKGWREENEIHIAVSDQGIGIDPQDIENIFKPFHRAAATKNSIPGIGLGLSASRRIIEAHGGKLQAENAPGKGSIFHIILPSQEMAKQLSKLEVRSKEYGSTR